jgi:hypothetical protein
MQQPQATEQMFLAFAEERAVPEQSGYGAVMHGVGNFVGFFGAVQRHLMFSSD